MVLGQHQGRFAQAHGEEVLLAVGAHLGHVGEGDGVEVGPALALVGHQRGLVGDDGAVGVLQAVLDDGERVEQQTLARTLTRRAVQLERGHRRGEGLGEAGGVVLHGGDEVERRHLGLHRATRVGQVAGFEGDGERLVVETGGICQLGEAVQSFGFRARIGLRAREHTGLLHQ